MPGGIFSEDGTRFSSSSRLPLPRRRAPFRRAAEISTAFDESRRHFDVATTNKRRVGVHEAADERVLLVTKHRITGAERCDWWPSVQEAERSDQIVLEVRDKIRIQKHKSNWTGLASVLGIVLGRSGTQDHYVRDRSLDQKEFFESVEDKKRRPSNA
jgi:hypothetical protein